MSYRPLFNLDQLHHLDMLQKARQAATIQNEQVMNLSQRNPAYYSMETPPESPRTRTGGEEKEKASKWVRGFKIVFNCWSRLLRREHATKIT